MEKNEQGGECTLHAEGGGVSECDEGDRAVAGVVVPRGGRGNGKGAGYR